MKQKQTHRHREWTGCQGGKRAGGMFGVGRCKLLYICVCVTESLYCTPETNNTINQPYFKKIKFLKETFSTKVTEGKV